MNLYFWLFVLSVIAGLCACAFVWQARQAQIDAEREYSRAAEQEIDTLRRACGKWARDYAYLENQIETLKLIGVPCKIEPRKTLSNGHRATGHKRHAWNRRDPRFARFAMRQRASKESR